MTDSILALGVELGSRLSELRQVKQWVVAKTTIAEHGVHVCNYFAVPLRLNYYGLGVVGQAKCYQYTGVMRPPVRRAGKPAQ